MSATKKRRLTGLLCMGGALLCGWCSATPADGRNPWRKFKEPAPGPAEAIGSYSAGCLRGAVRLPDDFPGYLIMRPYRHRFFAHPDLLQFIENLASLAQAQHLGTLLIGDAGQPRGGPSGSLHASHQTGLDVDIWYWRLPSGKSLTLKKRNRMNAPLMVTPPFKGLTKRWRRRNMEILKLAAQAPRVDRIFVNPVIKREVCKAHAGEAWVAKLRPWWGHDEHFHVRLLCPEHSPRCDQGKEDHIPSGDGCGTELDDWFRSQSKAKARYRAAHPEPVMIPELPAACSDLNP